MGACAECGRPELGAMGIAHKNTCSLKPQKKKAPKCKECGVPSVFGSYNHKPNCSLKKKIDRDHYARSIGEVCKVGMQGVLPMKSAQPAKPHISLPNGVDLLKGEPSQDLPAVNDLMIERLLSALASAINGDRVKVRSITDPMSIRTFRKLNESGQLQLINQIWNAVSTTHAFDTLGKQMSDPSSDAMDGDVLPSSVCPVKPGESNFKKRLSGQPFREFGIGFRVDGSNKSSLERVLNNGMKQQRLSAGFMLGPYRGLRLDRTVMMDTGQARCWTGNNDIFNETAVCVSRNFFGGTAFPERTTEGKCYLWAVDVGDLRGFDTEGYQLGLPNSRQWRPGEKAFPSIPKNNLVAYIEIDRFGAPKTGGWRVKIPEDANWKYVNQPSVKVRKYLEDELAAWRSKQVYTIPSTYDFAT